MVVAAVAVIGVVNVCVAVTCYSDGDMLPTTTIKPTTTTTVTATPTAFIS